ncbi:Cyclopropane mycolic acid synthase 2 [Bienertia sinuspersici]
MTFALLLKATELSLHFAIHLMMLRKFLSSLEVSKKGDISFFVGGVKRHMSRKQVNELFEFPLEGTIGLDSFKSFCEGVGDKGFVAKHCWKEVFYPKGVTRQVTTNDFRMLWWFVRVIQLQ